MTVGERIDKLCKKHNVSQSRLAKAIGYSRFTIMNWIHGRSSPSIDKLRKIAAVLNIPVDELINEELLTTKQNPEDIKNAPQVQTTSEGKRKIISLDEFLTVPIISREQTACCGSGIPASDITNNGDGYVQFQRSQLRAYDDLRPPFAIYCDGDCLESARIHDGDCVIINPAEMPLQGGVALVSRGGNLSLKRFFALPNGDVLLRSDFGETRLTPEEQERDEFAVIGAFICGTYNRPSPQSL